RLRHYGATEVFVFGSVARGEDTASSDIDLLVDRFDDGAYSWGMPKVKQELEDILGVGVDVGEIRTLGARLLQDALADARPL
ncbi:MAG: nucleotidyltransferase family protein, partial [Acidimicrobiales bacterium]